MERGEPGSGRPVGPLIDESVVGTSDDFTDAVDDAVPDPSDPDADAALGSGPAGLPERRTFLGEVVQRRAWYLIVPVFFFALFLGAMPFFFGVERSPYAEALELHARICRSPGAPASWADDLSVAGRDALARAPETVARALTCLDRAHHKTKLEPVRGRQFGADRAYVLTYMEPSTSDPRTIGPDDPVPLRMLFVVEADRLRWDPFGLPPAAGKDASTPGP